MNSRLAMKLIENQERLERTELLASFPEEWRQRLAEAQTIPSMEFLQNFPLNAEQELTSQSFLQRKLVDYQAFHRLGDARAYLDSRRFVLHPPVYCWFGKGPAFVFNESISLSWLAQIQQAKHFMIYVAESDFTKGAICCEYVGRLDTEIENPDWSCTASKTKDTKREDHEVVYEVLSFQPL